MTPSFSASSATVGGVTALTRRATAPSSTRTSSPGVKCASSSGKLTRTCASGVAPSSMVSPCFTAIGRARSPSRSLGPGRSMSTARGEPCRAAAARTSTMLRSCSAVLPCERLMRATSMPASTRRSSTGASRETGPRVATIFVRRRTGGVVRSSVALDRRSTHSCLSSRRVQSIALNGRQPTRLQPHDATRSSRRRRLADRSESCRLALTRCDERRERRRDRLRGGAHHCGDLRATSVWSP